MKKIPLILALLSSFCSYGQTQTSIPKDSLPIEVKKELVLNYSRFSIFNIVMENGIENRTIYKLKARKEKARDGKSIVTVFDLSFNKEGQLLSKSKSREIFYTGSIPKNSGGHSKDDGHNH